MRTRNRGYWDWISPEYISGNPTHDTTLRWPALTSWELMYDWKSKQRADEQVICKPVNSFAINPCLHFKWRYKGGAMPDWYGDHGYLASTPGVLPPVYGPSLEEISPPVQPAELENAHLEAFAAFGEQFPQYASAGELLETLRDLKGLLPSVSRSILKSLSSLYVQNELSWKPLQRDIENLYDLTKAVQDRIAFLKKTYMTPTKLRFKRAIPHTLAPWTSEWEPARGWRVRYERVSSHSVYIATATLWHALQHLDDWFAYLRGFVSAFGLDNPIKTVWEVIPYSFVVDRFFNLSNRLDAFARIKPADEWTLSNITWSLKTEYKYKLHRIVRDLIGWSDQDYNNVGEITQTVYRREVGFPADWWAVSLPQLSAGMFGLLGAMKASR